MRPRQVGSPIVDFQPFRRQKTRARETRRRRALRREPRSSDWPYDTAYLAGVKCTVTVTRNPRRRSLTPAAVWKNGLGKSSTARCVPRGQVENAALLRSDAIECTVTVIPLWLGVDNPEPGEIGRSVRIGITRDADRLLRFYLRGSPFVSGPRSLME